MQSPESGTADFAPRKFSIRETQGDRDVCMFPIVKRIYQYILNFAFLCFFSVNKEEKDLFEKKKDPSGGQFVNPVDDPSRTIGQAKAKVLQNVDTFFYIGTEVCLR